ncbi:MAG TPA: hypothetical protein VLF65_12650 [Burkholderiales bacterium]|jgi:hypothetical protein|nr:hypothetical protein [Burkholderiales bacterium]
MIDVFAFLMVVATADGASRDFTAVVCVSEAGGPWALKARGTLTRTRSKNETAYRFKSDEHSFEWRFVASAQGNSTVQGPGYLMDRFLPEKKSSERSQSLGASGEIRESSGQDVLVLRLSPACPAKASRAPAGPSK